MIDTTKDLEIRSQLYSFIERIFPRLVSAVVVLSLAAVTTVTSVGAYAWSVLAFTAIQSITDSAARQIAVSAVRTDAGQRFLRAYASCVAVAGPCALFATLAALRELGVVTSTQALLLLPIVFAPGFSARSILALARLQAAGRWSVLATTQAMAALCASAVSIPVIVISESILGASLHLLLTEGLLWLLLRHRARLLKVQTTSERASERYLGDFARMSIYSLLAWSQGQADRIAIGTVAGTLALGQYSLGAALGRSAGDALSAGTANVLRSSLLGDIGDRARISGRTLRVGLSVGLATATASLIAIHIVDIALLGSEWDTSLAVSQILVLTVLPSVISWGAAPIHMVQGTTGRAWLAPLLGLFMVVPIALLADDSLIAAAWAVVLRDVVLALVSCALIGRGAPWGTFILMLPSVAIFGGIILMLF